MADPYSAILGTAVDAVSGIASGIPYLITTGADKNNAKRIKELKRLQSLNALGLSEDEKQQYYTALNQAAGAGREAISSQMESGIQSFNTSGAGKSLALAKAGEEAMGRIGTQIGQAVKAEDVAREDAMRQELEDRLAAKAERDRQMASAVTSMLMPILGSSTQSGALKQTTSVKPQPGAVSANPATPAPTDPQEEIDQNDLSNWGF